MNINKLIQLLKKEINTQDSDNELQEVGEVLSIGDGIVSVYGLGNVGLNEIVRFESGKFGLVMDLSVDSVEIVLFDRGYHIHEGEKVFRTKSLMQVPVGKELLGRVINVFGEPIDGGSKIASKLRQNIHGTVPGIVDRQSIFEPLKTGILAIDALIPIGRGQRELIIGDRKTGKTSIALDTIINQKNINATVPDDQKVYCIYVAIGQRQSSIVHIANMLKEVGAMSYTTIVSASASEPASLNYIAPFVGCTIGEYFRDNGMHALIIYDDLSKHAVAYRQLSLLLRRPPGREAFPGDIFYLHSRLLERSAKLKDSLKGGSLTSLPIVEIQAGDISAYIPTNIISITDGQIFLDTDLFYAGNRPAVSTGLSVSRVGSSAQTKLMRGMVKNLKLELSQFRELSNFAQFGSDVDKQTSLVLEKGKRIMEALKQPVGKPMSEKKQVIIIFIFNNNLLNDLDLELIKPCLEHILLTVDKEKAGNDLIENFMKDLNDVKAQKSFCVYVQNCIKKFLKSTTKAKAN